VFEGLVKQEALRSAMNDFCTNKRAPQDRKRFNTLGHSTTFLIL
jgi:hypothetical protein